MYILHSGAGILYVGQTTTGKFGTFGERLRRHFHGPSSAESATHRLLVQSGPIRAHLIDLETVDALVSSDGETLTKARKALVLEQVLIGLFAPPGNRR